MLRSLRRCRGVAWVALVCLLALVGCGGGSGTSAPLDDYSGAAAKRLAGAALNFTAVNLAVGATGGVGKYMMDMVLEAIFGPQGSDAEIKDQLDQMNQKLDEVLEKLDEIGAKLDDVLKAISKARDQLETLNQRLAIKDPIDTIHADYKNLNRLAVRGSDSSTSNDPRPSEADALAADIIDTSRHDIPLQLEKIHSGIVGGTASARGVLEEWTDELATSVQEGRSLLDCYLTLEHYFGELLTVQTKGLILVTNALRQQDSQDDGRYVGSEEDYVNSEFWPNISRQLRVFCRCVDRLVVAQAQPDEKGFVTQAGNVQEVYSRTDWLAAQCSEHFSAECPYHWDYGFQVHILQDMAKVTNRGKDERPVDVQWKNGTQWVSLAQTPAWLGLTNKNFKSRYYATEQYADCSGYDNPTQKLYSNWISVSNKVYINALQKTDATPGQYHLRAVGATHKVHPNQRPEFDAKCGLYDDEYRAVASGTPDARVFGTLVIDYRKRDLWWRWVGALSNGGHPSMVGGWVVKATDSNGGKVAPGMVTDPTKEGWVRVKVTYDGATRYPVDMDFTHTLRSATDLYVDTPDSNKTFKVVCEAKRPVSGKKKFKGLLDFNVGELEFTSGSWTTVSTTCALKQGADTVMRLSSTVRPYAHKKPLGMGAVTDPTWGTDPSVGGECYTHIRNIKVYLPD